MKRNHNKTRCKTDENDHKSHEMSIKNPRDE